MQTAMLYDYDDMILRLTHALEVFPELKYNLQEQYQYILVDEFQDTNGAQMRILLSLTDNPALENRPNILVVGDDDQAIYSFQGAEISNILAFQKKFDPLIVNVRANYRSAPVILEHARQVISLGSARLETTLQNVDKTPLPQQKTTDSRVVLLESPDVASEYNALAETIAARVKSGQTASSIVVLARNHRDIRTLLPYISQRKIRFSYEHQDDILESPPVKALIDLAQIVVWLAEGKLDQVNTRMPELLTHPAWHCAPSDLWQVSLAAYQQHKTWLEVMGEGDNIYQAIAEFLVTAAYHSNHQSLEEAIDSLLGVTTLTHDAFSFRSPLYDYFFPADHQKNPNELLKNINTLSHLRRLLRDYAPNTSASLKDFVEFVGKTKAAGIRLSLNNDANIQEEAVHIMTAHKAKGLEYDTVFIVNASDQTWGARSRGRPSRLSYPANLPIALPGENEDERLRLFFVAMTRAKRELIISFAAHDDAGKASLRASFLQSDAWDKIKSETKPEAAPQQLETALVTWQNVISQPSSDLTSALKPILKDYRLSVTHLNSFLDVTRGGPRNFLLQTLLRFPKATSPQAALGSAIHSTLKRAHDHLSATKERRPLEDVLYDFETSLAQMHLSRADFSHQLQKGSDALQAYLAARYDQFNPEQIGERSFRHQGVTVGEARLTGIIDVISLDKAAKTITVTDYKTGKPVFGWKGKSDYDKIKLHHYKQQLMFYKLLVENSSEFHNFKVEKGILDFIEPDPGGDLAQLELSYDTSELTHFTKLIAAVWQRIMRTDFVDTSSYPQSFKGILAFEEDLLEG
jgi:DNA helicase-2/ATP-dependent DNA helicase PcrA